MSRKARPLAERYWEKVDKSGGDDACWPWMGNRMGFGYGQFWYNGRPHASNRIAWYLTTGEWPGELVIRHKCDNPACCNPAHLEAGTMADNVDDCIRRGRHIGPDHAAWGERNGNAKWSNATVLEIKRKLKDGKRQRDIAREYGVYESKICDIVHGRTWRHLQLPTEE